MTERVWRTAALVVLAIGVAWTGAAFGWHASADASWRRVRERVGHADYDAARSDTLYERVYAARENVRRGATLVGLALLALGCALPRRAVPPSPLGSGATPPVPSPGAPSERRSPGGANTGRRLWLGTLVDGAGVAVGLVVLSALVRVVDRAGSEATAASLGRLVPFGVLAAYAALVRVAVAPGARLAPLAATPAPWQVLIATLALLPCALLALLAAPVVLVAPAWPLARTLAAPHRALARCERGPAAPA